MGGVMTKTLAQAFRSGSGRKAKWNGQTVHSFHQISVKPGNTIEITRMSDSSTRAQALKLALDRGDLRVNGIVASSLSIWTHTSPSDVSIEVVGKKARTLDIWNSWSFDGVDSSWLGSAGMLVEDADNGDGYILRCSDGLGEPTFEDLVVEVRIRTGVQ